MQSVVPKKSLGQHFLKDENIARKIVSSLKANERILEIGPGTGVLTKYLIPVCKDFKAIEIDKEVVGFLEKEFPELENRIINDDFLKCDLNSLFEGSFSIIGNFPYNISSQIFFKIINYQAIIQEIVCMLQKDVAERLAAKPGNKSYGVLTVILGAYYKIKYLFTVNEQVFFPPPKVKSAVIRLERTAEKYPDIDKKLFFNIVKTGFNQRRKTLKNSLRKLWADKINPDDYPVFNKRPEQLTINDFFDLTKILS